MTSLIFLGAAAIKKHQEKYSKMRKISEKYFNGEEVTRKDMAEYYSAKVGYNMIPFIKRKNYKKAPIKGQRAFEYLEKNFSDIVKKPSMADLSSYVCSLGTDKRESRDR